MWRTAVGKALPIKEREYLRNATARAAKNVKVPVVVNIGVFRCASMYCLRAGSSAARLFGVDIEKCPTKIHPSLQAKFIIADSAKCHVGFKEPIHVLFIDGDHHYKPVLADLNNWAAKVVVGGEVILHDCFPKPKALSVKPHLEGVNRAVSGWFAEQPPEKWEEQVAPCSLRAFVRLR